MKKSKFLTCLSAAFITAFALMSCNNVVQGRGHVVLSIDGVEYTAEELFNDQKSPEAAEAKFNGVYKALIRNYFATTEEGKSLKDEVKRETDIKISSKKAEAKSNAKKNGTSYDTEWNKILDENDCDTTDELYDKFEYDVQKQKFDDKLYDHKFTENGVEKTNYDVLRDGGFFDGKNLDDKYKIKGYLKNRFPYHIKHILVKLSNAGTDPVNATITEAEALKINRVVTALARGDDFGQLAAIESDDGSGKESKGSVGIMSKQTSFVHEMQFGTYLYDAFYNDTTSGVKDNDGADSVYFGKMTETERFDNSAAKTIFGIEQNPTDKPAKGTAASYALDLTGFKDPTSRQKSETGNWGEGGFSGIGQIPYEAALALGPSDVSYEFDGGEHFGVGDIDYEDKEEIFKKAGVDDKVPEKFYPRNVIFNKYFNKHNIMVITPTSMPMLDLGLIEPKTEQDTEQIYKPEDDTSENTSFIEYKQYGTTEHGSDRTSKHDYYQGVYDNKFAGLNGFKYANTKTETDKLAKNNDILSSKKTYKDDEQTEHTTKDVGLYTHAESEASKNSDKRVLRDNEGRTILVIRAGTGSNSSNDDSGYQGIHFFVIERSPFIEREFDKNDPADNNDYYTTLDEYYTQYYPNSTDTRDSHRHPYYASTEEFEPKLTFAHYLHEEENKEKVRADLVKKELTNTASTANTNPNLNLYTYKYLEHGIEFKGEIGEQIKEQINNWIDVKLDTRSEDKKWNKDWKEYHDELEYQQFIRDEKEIGTEKKVSSQLISEACAVAFAKADVSSDEDVLNALRDMFGKGGIFHE